VTTSSIAIGETQDADVQVAHALATVIPLRAVADVIAGLLDAAAA